MILVEPVGEEYRVSIEVSEDVEYDIDGEPVLTPNTLFLHWGMHREWLDLMDVSLIFLGDLNSVMMIQEGRQLAHL